jgi:IS30 family transposase
MSYAQTFAATTKKKSVQELSMRHMSATVALSPGAAGFIGIADEAKVAQRSADSRQRDSRTGINCTEEEFVRIIGIVKPLLRQGLGLDAIWCAHKDELLISKRTFYRWADLGLGVINMELPKKVSYRPRKKNVSTTPKQNLEGKLFSDFQSLPEQVRSSAFEMDCIEGKKSDKKVILTLLHRRSNFQLGILLERHTSECVVSALNWIEMICGECFKKLFAVILTDRGHEFSDIAGMERGLDGKKRTTVYFCDPQRPDQKATCERMHVDVRKILPKGSTSLDELTPWDIATVFSQVNSIPRPSLGGVKPIALAQAQFPKRLFDELGLSCVPTKDICLKPSLLTRKEDSRN